MTLEKLYAIIEDRIRNRPEGSYIASLVQQGKDRIIQKVGEEAVEVVIAAKNTDRRRKTGEIADLVFHLLVLMVSENIRIREIEEELERRHCSIVHKP